ncbi:MAG: hypothetical protein JST67_09490 [Bacteroidetes bacterium]|nr:hypothetical protein [Bacteroidota bacterium]
MPAKKKNVQILLSLIAFCLGFILSCKKDVVATPPDLGYNYYPGTIKSYIIYDVDSIIYRQVQGDTLSFHFQIKEVMDSLITDNQNRPTIKIIRYKRQYSSPNWILQRVWVANKNTTDVEVVEENIRYTKLAFPAGAGKQWNGLAWADSTPVQNYIYANYDVPLTLNGNYFSKSLTVNQLYAGNKLYYQNFYEQYARGVGLICKYQVSYTYPNTFPLDSGKIIGGKYYVMNINSYGNE